MAALERPQIPNHLALSPDRTHAASLHEGFLARCPPRPPLTASRPNNSLPWPERTHSGSSIGWPEPSPEGAAKPSSGGKSVALCRSLPRYVRIL